VLVCQRGQVGHEIPVPGEPEREYGFRTVLQRGQPPFAQPQSLRIGERSGEVGQRYPAPQCERAVQLVQRRRLLATGQA